MEKVNEALLHETGHAVDSAKRSKELKKRDALLRTCSSLSLYIGMTLSYFTGLYPIADIQQTDLGSSDIIAVGLFSLSVAKLSLDTTYWSSRSERYARKFARQMGKDPQFKSLIRFK